MLEPYKEDPEATEENALEEESAWKLNLLMTDLSGRCGAFSPAPCTSRTRP